MVRNHRWLGLCGIVIGCIGGGACQSSPILTAAQSPPGGQAAGVEAAPTATGDAPVNNATAVGDANYNTSTCSLDLQSAMAFAGDTKKMNQDQQQETCAAVISAAKRHYPDLPARTVAQLLIANMRQESDFDPNNISGERDGSGDAYGLLQVSPFGDSRELQLFAQHCDVTGLVDYRTKQPIDVTKLVADDLKDPWLNVHVASWIQSNLARSGSADPSAWGKSQGPVPPSYLTGLGSWVAGPATGAASGYTRSGDDISASYFAGILKDLNHLTGRSDTAQTLAALALSPNVVRFRP